MAYVLVVSNPKLWLVWESRMVYVANDDPALPQTWKSIGSPGAPSATREVTLYLVRVAVDGY